MSGQPFKPRVVVAISAPDSLGGGVIVPAVAERLGVSHQPLSAPRSVPGAGEDAPDDQTFRERSEREIERLRTTGGVIRDAAAAVLLAGDPSVLRVRLDGPMEARVRLGGIAANRPEAEIRPLLAQRDAAWAAFHRTCYASDLAETHWYHMILDSTALDWDLCVDLIAVAARGLTAPRGGSGGAERDPAGSEHR